MGLKRSESSVRSLRALFDVGTLAACTDGQLLERFASRRGESSEAAFATLVDRHGAMVLRTCRGVLRNAHDVEDAFQATFLILARRGGSLWVRDSVAPWLHRVAVRTSVRASRDAIRRRSIERRAAGPEGITSVEPDGDELIRMVHEEINRLPARYRVPLVLCELEGRTYEEAARHLGCPVGTIKSRLARGRDRLRDRLERRGAGQGAAVLGLRLADPGRPALPCALARATVHSAVGFGRIARYAGIGLAGSTAATLANGVIRSMALAKLSGALVAVLAVVTALSGLAIGFGIPAQQAPADNAAAAPNAAPSEQPKTERDWQRVGTYQAPDFDRFFPDDPKAGEVLDQLIKTYDKDPRPDTEKLRIVRQGLRRAQTNRASLLTVVGNTYIWGKSPQHPDAIEIMYHAADFRGNDDNPNGTLLHAIHNGLSVVKPKSPAILRTFVDLCMTKDDPNYIDRIVWGTADQRSELIAFLKPYYKSGDKATRQRALEMRKVLGGELKAFEWAGNRLRRRAQANFGQRLPEIKRTLRDGTAAERLKAFELIERERLDLIMDGSFVAAFAACGDDQDTQVRRGVARLAGEFWIWRADPQNPDAIKLLLRLSRDANAAVRSDAVYFGLSTVGDQSEEIVRAMIECALTDRRVVGRVAWGLDGDNEGIVKILNEMLRDDDPGRAAVALEIYRGLAQKNSDLGPGNDSEPAGTFTEPFRDLYEHLGRTYPEFHAKKIDWAKIGQELQPRASKIQTEQEFGLLVEELVARLEDSHAVVVAGSANPPIPDLQEWGPGLACVIDDRGLPVVYTVDRGSPAEKAGIAPGRAITSVNGVPSDAALRQWMQRTRTFYGYSSERTLKYDAARAFVGQPKRGGKLTLKLEDPDGRATTVDLLVDRHARYMPSLPVPRPGFSEAVSVAWTALDGRIGYIRVRRIQAGLEGSLDQALKDLGDIKGLIIDVRGNSGGGFDVSTAFVNFDSAEKKIAGPERPKYKGRIALLIDERCISAGEGWASWFVARKRARLFGTTTAGASCRKEIYTLTNGFYRVVVPVKAYTGFLDRPIERRGIEPDVEVRCTARDLARGRDTVVDAAAAWLAHPGGD